MKYFTIATLFALAVNASSSPTTTAAATSSSSSGFWDELAKYAGELKYDLESVMSKPKNYIKAEIKAPKAKTTENLVVYAPGDNCCVFAGPSDFWSNLYRATDPKLIEKIIFCPGAIEYLSSLDAIKVASNKSDAQLRDVLAALMLRRETLIGLYSNSYIHGHFHTCFQALWDKVSQRDAINIEHWPCDQNSCSPQTISKGFADFFESNEACKIVLKDQFPAYTQAVLDGVKANKLTVSPAVREALRENLHKVPHLGMPFVELYDAAAEAPRVAVAERIQQVLADIKGMLEKQFNHSSTVYADAENIFKQRLATINNPNVKTEDCDKGENTNTSDKSDKSELSNSNSKSEPTKTVAAEPTKTSAQE